MIHVFSYGAARPRELRTGRSRCRRRRTRRRRRTSRRRTRKKVAWPDRLAISPDGATLLVPLNLADAAAIVDVARGRCATSTTGRYPYGAAILPDGKTGLVSNETPGTVSVIDLASAARSQGHPGRRAPLAPRGDRDRPAAPTAPTSRSPTPTRSRSSTPRRPEVEQTLRRARAEGIGTSPDRAHGRRTASCCVAEAGADELAVFGAGRLTVRSAGSRPPRTRPTSRRRRGKREASCVWLSAKGLGTGPNPNGPDPQSPDDSDDRDQRVRSTCR